MNNVCPHCTNKNNEIERLTEDVEELKRKEREKINDLYNQILAPNREIHFTAAQVKHIHETFKRVQYHHLEFKV